jgi:hypothetical protein
VCRSSGIIEKAFVLEFEAQSKNGKMRVQITNTGTILADYSVTVTECSEGIKPIIAKRTSMAPAESKELEFGVYSQYELEAENQCTGIHDYHYVPFLHDQFC